MNAFQAPISLGADSCSSYSGKYCDWRWHADSGNNLSTVLDTIGRNRSSFQSSFFSQLFHIFTYSTQVCWEVSIVVLASTKGIHIVCFIVFSFALSFCFVHMHHYSKNLLILIDFFFVPLVYYQSWCTSLPFEPVDK